MHMQLHDMLHCSEMLRDHERYSRNGVEYKHVVIARIDVTLFAAHPDLLGYRSTRITSGSSMGMNKRKLDLTQDKENHLETEEQDTVPAGKQPGYYRTTRHRY
ncbi:unnamed protein product [Amoebophrya sp. A25]|nr:unnamed protein product [Amoebophrya sp. A25]|eukprot:GSA25T00012712001.1